METPTPDGPMSKLMGFWASRGMVVIAGLALVGIAVHLVLRYGLSSEAASYEMPLWIVLGFGGMPLLYGLLKKLAKFEFGSDLLAGISIVTAVLLGEYLAGALVVLMLSGGEAIESYAVRSASSVLRALAQRMPSLGHRRHGSERDRDGPRQRRPVVPRGWRADPGDDRRLRDFQRLASGDPAQGTL